MFMTKNPVKRLSERPQKNGQEVGGWYSAVKNSWRNEDKGNKNQVLLRALGIDCHEKTGLQILLGSLYVIQQKDTLIPQFT